jgi:hypothetical protein
MKGGTPFVPAEFVTNQCVTALALVLENHLSFYLISRSLYKNSGDFVICYVEK